MRQGHDALFWNVDGNRVLEVSRGSVPDRCYCYVARAISSEQRTVPHVHPSVAVRGYSLRLKMNERNYCSTYIMVVLRESNNENDFMSFRKKPEFPQEIRKSGVLKQYNASFILHCYCLPYLSALLVGVLTIGIGVAGPAIACSNTFTFTSRNFFVGASLCFLSDACGDVYLFVYLIPQFFVSLLILYYNISKTVNCGWL